MVINPLQKQTYGVIGLREFITRSMVNFHYQYYHQFTYKNKYSWNMSNEQLLSFPTDTLGHHLGQFLRQNGLSLIPKFENHDIFHILLDYGLTVPDEIAMQCCLAGSGRRTFSTAITIIIGMALYPECWSMFLKCYQRGKKLRHFSYWDFKPLLTMSITALQQTIQLKTQQN